MNKEKFEEEYKKQLNHFKWNQYKYPFQLIFQQRAFHAFCVGTPKSGTHSIASMLRQYKTSHEPDTLFIINLINKVKNNELSHGDLEAILKARDRSNWLEIESSHYIGHFVEELSCLFTQAKFILTIRDCLSWLDSWFNHQLSRLGSLLYDVGRANYYDRGFSYTKHDQFLEEMNLYPLKSYLIFWTERNLKILNTVPDERLLVLKTHEISDSSSEIARFLNISETRVKARKSHKFKAKEKHSILKKFDANFLHDTTMEICADINDRYFPEKTIQETVRNITS